MAKTAEAAMEAWGSEVEVVVRLGDVLDGVGELRGSLGLGSQRRAPWRCSCAWEEKGEAAVSVEAIGKKEGGKTEREGSTAASSSTSASAEL